MSEDLLVKAERRSKLGTVDAKRLRASGRVPANIYGLGQPGESVSVCGETVEKLVATRSSVVDVELDGKVNKAVVQELQWDVFSTEVQHLDLRRVDPDGRATVDVLLELRGEPLGLKDGGAIRQLHKKVSLSCPDYRIPKSIVVRIGGLRIGDAVKGSDLQLPEHAQLVTAADELIVELYDPAQGSLVAMKLVVGLGNPGSQYSGTRHNIGFDVVAELAQRWQCGRPQLKFQAEVREAFPVSGKVLLVAPMTYMNRSGESVQQIARFYQVPSEDVVVICDDLNLPLGRLRWRAGGSAGGQKGLADILLRLGTEKVPRLRVGVGRPPGSVDPAAWVLARFRSEERVEAELMAKLAADSIECWVAEGIVSTMNKFNRSEE